MKFMNAQRVRLLGHVKRMEVRAMVREMMEGRRKGRHLLRWMNDVVADRKAMKIKQWMEKMKDREKWRLIVEEAKAHPGLQHREKGRESNSRFVKNASSEIRNLDSCKIR